MIFAKIDTTSKLELFAIMEACTHLKTKEEFQTVLESTKSLFGHEMAACGIGEVITQKVGSTINSGFPNKFMSSIIDHHGRMDSPLFNQWIKQKSPQVLNFHDKNKLSSIGDRIFYRNFALRNILSHGVMDFNQNYVTYFGFAQFPGEITESHIRLLEILAPHLHVAYMRVAIGHAKTSQRTNLAIEKKNLIHNWETNSISKREKEVLKWVLVGKTNWDISNILSISENTVKNHVLRILKKLGANNRQHAVAKAIKMGIIEL